MFDDDDVNVRQAYKHVDVALTAGVGRNWVDQVKVRLADFANADDVKFQE